MSTATQRDTVAAWCNDFGNAYIERNEITEENIQIRLRSIAKIMDHLRGCPPKTILEIGCNVGMNQRALKRLTSADLYAIEPNERARTICLADGVLPPDRLFDATAADLPFDDGSMDFVFTSGVLIHVPPDQLDQACKEIYRVSSKYIMCREYFAHTPETITYRGEEGLLFKRDFGGHFMDLFPDLEPIAEGFFWQRTTGIDNGTWWLFRKG